MPLFYSQINTIREIDISGRQNGFRKRMGTSVAIFIVRNPIEKHIERQTDLVLTLVYLEKVK